MNHDGRTVLACVTAGISLINLAISVTLANWYSALGWISSLTGWLTLYVIYVHMTPLEEPPEIKSELQRQGVLNEEPNPYQSPKS